MRSDSSWAPGHSHLWSASSSLSMRTFQDRNSQAKEKSLDPSNGSVDRIQQSPISIVEIRYHTPVGKNWPNTMAPPSGATLSFKLTETP